MEVGANVTFFANTRLKAKRISTSRGIEKVYPLYATLMYGQTNTHLRVEHEDASYLVSEDLHQLQEEPLLNDTKLFKESILRVLRKEEAYFGTEKYAIKGFAKRLKFYQEDVVKFLLDIKVSELITTIKKLNIAPATSHQYEYVAILQSLTDILVASKQPTVSIFDWQFENGKEELGKLLLSINNEDENQLKTVINLFNYCIHHSLYQLPPRHLS